MPWGVVGAAVIGAGADMAEGSANRSAMEKQNASTAYINDSQKDLLSRSKAIADRPYTPYTGDRVAGQSANETTAYNMASNAANFNDARGYMDKAGKSIDGVSSWSTDTLNKYMNPYVGAVVDSSLKNENTAYQQGQNKLKSQAASIGAFGGDRATLLESENTGQHLKTVGDITSKGYSDAYDKAVSTWQADNNTKLNASKAYSAVGEDISKLNSNQITDLLKTGQADTVMRQMKLDVNYNDFLEKRDWSVSNLQPLMSAVGSAKGGSSTAQPVDHTASQLAGLASTLVGYFGSKGNNTQQQDSTWTAANTGSYGGIGAGDAGYGGVYDGGGIDGGGMYGGSAGGGVGLA